MFEGTSKEKFFYHNTLLCLVRSLLNKNITVDLRNDSYICGNVTNVDGYMNMTFSHPVYCDPQGNEYCFENLFIQGRNIRYIHIPESISIMNAIRNELHKQKFKGNDDKPKERTRKVKKAMKQHMEIVASLDT